LSHQYRKLQRLYSCLMILLVFALAACSSAEKAVENSHQATDSASGEAIAVQDSAVPTEQQGPTASQPKSEAAAPAGASSGTLPAASPRKMIYRANLQAEVENVNKARSQITSLAARFQGYILSSSDYETEKEKGANITVRIPQAGFTSFLDEMEKLATKVPVRSIEGQDVTEEYVDLSSRLKARQAVETRLLAFMAEAQKTEDLLKISNDLARVQEEIEQLKGRMRYLDEHVAYSTISLALIEKKVTAKLGDVTDASTWKTAWLSFHQSLLGILSFLKALIVFIAAAVPVLVFLCIPGLPLFFYYKRYRKKKQLLAPPPTND